MLEIVPVPELAINVQPGQRIEPDAELYSFFRDQVFLGQLVKTLSKDQKKIIESGSEPLFERFQELNVANKVASFDSKRLKVIRFQNTYFGFEIKDTSWNGIDLYQFDDEEECLEYFGLNTKAFRLRRVFLPFLKWRIDV